LAKGSVSPVFFSEILPEITWAAENPGINMPKIKKLIFTDWYKEKDFIIILYRISGIKNTTYKIKKFLLSPF